MNSGVPNKINNVVKDFASSICTGEPFYIYVQPESFCKNNWCFQNVEEKIRRDGGEAVLGWSIMWVEHKFIEAEFHSVWKSPAGSLIDITPLSKLIKSDKILFLKDSEKEYEGLRVDVIRKPLCDDPFINDYIKIARVLFKIVEKIQEPHETRLYLHDDDAMVYNQIQRLISVIAFMCKEERNINSLCICGSNKKYKHCCGKKVKKILKKYS